MWPQTWCFGLYWLLWAQGMWKTKFCSPNSLCLRQDRKKWMATSPFPGVSLTQPKTLSQMLIILRPIHLSKSSMLFRVAYNISLPIPLRRALVFYIFTLISCDTPHTTRAPSGHAHHKAIHLFFCLPACCQCDSQIQTLSPEGRKKVFSSLQQQHRQLCLSMNTDWSRLGWNLLYNPGWPQTQDPPASTSWMLEL
jgi:hypothetical protein